MLILLSVAASAQYSEETRKFRFLKLETQYGMLLPTTVYEDEGGLTDIQASQAAGLSLELGWQGSGRDPYDHLLNFPTYGIGINTYTFPRTSQLGYPNAIYLFLNAPAKRWDKWSLNYILKLGFSYNWRPHDPVDNPIQFAVGSFRNLFINAGMEGSYMLGERTDLGRRNLIFTLFKWEELRA